MQKHLVLCWLISLILLLQLSEKSGIIRTRSVCSIPEQGGAVMFHSQHLINVLYVTSLTLAQLMVVDLRLNFLYGGNHSSLPTAFTALFRAKVKPISVTSHCTVVQSFISSHTNSKPAVPYLHSLLKSTTPYFRHNSS